MDTGLIEVRVAVGMAGASVGQYRWVDPSDPYIKERLTLGYLVRTGVTMSDDPDTANEEPVTEEQGEASPPEPDAAAQPGG